MSSWEILLGCALGLALAAAWLAVLAPARFRASFEAGRGVALTGSAHLSWGPLGFGVASVPGRLDRARFSFYLFGRCVYSRESSAGRRARERGEDFSATDAMESVLEGYRGYDERVGVADTLRFFVRERRRVVIDELAGRVRYGFEDFEKTGELSGYLWALRGVLGPAFNIHHEPDWSGRPVLAGAARVALRAYPALLAIDVMLFAFARARPARREVAAGSEAAHA